MWPISAFTHRLVFCLHAACDLTAIPLQAFDARDLKLWMHINTADIPYRQPGRLQTCGRRIGISRGAHEVPYAPRHMLLYAHA